MPKVPKKNISSEIKDIKAPNGSQKKDEAIKGDVLADSFSPVPRPEEKFHRLATRKLVLIGVVFVTLSLIAAFAAYQGKAIFGDSVSSGISRFESALEKLRVFDFKEAREDLNQANKEISGIPDPDSLSILNFFPWAKEGLQAFGSFKDIIVNSSALAAELDGISSGLFDFALGGQGGELISKLEEIKSIVSNIKKDSEILASSTSHLARFLPFDPENYLPLSSELDKYTGFLNSALAWLKSPDEHHLAIFLQNPSELRPGGGFMGSFIEVTVEGGSITDMRARDINEVDREFERKIIPPQPLQPIIKRWRSADANWFFDFEDSASKTLEFMEESDFYKASSTKFDGAIAISPLVISDILSLTGPLEIPEKRLVFDKDNFLIEIQRQVQEGQEKGDKAPKEIIGKLVPVLIEKMRNLTGEQKKEIAGNLEKWVAKKDLLMYFKNPDFQRITEYYGASGNVFKTPSDFNGDYLAIVNSDIGGGKSDLFMDQTVVLQSQLNADGRVDNHLVISRLHSGGKAEDWWYRVTNQEYIKVFAPEDARVSGFSGGWDRTVSPRVDYRKEGFSSDPQVSAIEGTLRKDLGFPGLDIFKESGKTVLASWSRTALSKATTISFDYVHRMFVPPYPGQKYEFVFEKQPGSRGKYSFELNAPLGYRWKENQLPTFEYDTEDPPGRLEIVLTLEKSGE